MQANLKEGLPQGGKTAENPRLSKFKQVLRNKVAPIVVRGGMALSAIGGGTAAQAVYDMSRPTVVRAEGNGSASGTSPLEATSLAEAGNISSIAHEKNGKLWFTHTGTPDQLARYDRSEDAMNTYLDKMNSKINEMPYDELKSLNNEMNTDSSTGFLGEKSYVINRINTQGSDQTYTSQHQFGPFDTSLEVDSRMPNAVGIVLQHKEHRVNPPARNEVNDLDQLIDPYFQRAVQGYMARNLKRIVESNPEASPSAIKNRVTPEMRYLLIALSYEQAMPLLGQMIEGEKGGKLQVEEALGFLYEHWKVINIDPATPDDEKRTRFLNEAFATYTRVRNENLLNRAPANPTPLPLEGAMGGPRPQTAVNTPVPQETQRGGVYDPFFAGQDQDERYSSERQLATQRLTEYAQVIERINEQYPNSKLKWAMDKLRVSNGRSFAISDREFFALYLQTSLVNNFASRSPQSEYSPFNTVVVNGGSDPKKLQYNFNVEADSISKPYNSPNSIFPLLEIVKHMDILQQRQEMVAADNGAHDGNYFVTQFNYESNKELFTTHLAHGLWTTLDEYNALKGGGIITAANDSAAYQGLNNRRNEIIKANANPNAQQAEWRLFVNQLYKLGANPNLLR